MEQLRKRVFRKIKPKVVNGTTLNGLQLLDMCKAYIECINTGKIPTIESAWNYMCRSEARKSAASAIHSLEAQLEAELKAVTDKPLDSKRLQDMKVKVRTA